MDELAYERLAEQTFRTIEDAFRDADTDVVDCERSGDVMTFTFRGGKRCVVNTQRAVRQMWLAADARGWHFTWDGQRWLDDKGRGDELFGTLARIVKESAGVDVTF